MLTSFAIIATQTNLNNLGGYDDCIKNPPGKHGEETLELTSTYSPFLLLPFYLPGVIKPGSKDPKRFSAA
ncbi:hypothetical protein VIOR3934_19405 [Vibrio orientalis CIP 102891 = ATCC 33934]|uniref:Uncharacterized protein n=1 Tax=Vibrio orientalis CIP 102891 = ATCC 33934 TaxID=675816 RepID=F9SMH1_VIBOR|nr:hypothetical protein [Vibrio orientalis]EGU54026.1 hypothetical protein VIOR3934_19405 [Vibrio orientalis CIP 102891 = ATCC 33934]